VILLTNVYVHPTAIVDKDVCIGDGTKVWHFVHIMSGVNIGKDCLLGDYVHVGRDVKIGNHVKLENRATVYTGVTIEDKVFVGPHVTFTNDMYPRSCNKDWKITTTKVKEGSSIGAGSVIRCGVTIGEYSLVGAGSVVTSDVPAHALVFGNPLRSGVLFVVGQQVVVTARKRTCFDGAVFVKNLQDSRGYINWKMNMSRRIQSLSHFGLEETKA
jgi:acetyltransferase-like isoleucine patch superfamily enzyme